MLQIDGRRTRNRRGEGDGRAGTELGDQLIGGGLYFSRHRERGFKVLVNADQGRDEGAARSDGEPRSSSEPSLRNGESELPGLKQ